MISTALSLAFWLTHLVLPVGSVSLSLNYLLACKYYMRGRKVWLPWCGSAPLSWSRAPMGPRANAPSPHSLVNREPHTCSLSWTEVLWP